MSEESTKKVDRRLAYQRRHVAQGLCKLCSEPGAKMPNGKISPHCISHLGKNADYQARKANGKTKMINSPRMQAIRIKLGRDPILPIRSRRLESDLPCAGF